MSFAFDPHQGLVIVSTEITGPSGTALLRLALDTGATSTLINVATLVSLSYDTALAPDRIRHEWNSSLCVTGIAGGSDGPATGSIGMPRTRLDGGVASPTWRPR